MFGGVLRQQLLDFTVNPLQEDDAAPHFLPGDFFIHIRQEIKREVDIKKRALDGQEALGDQVIEDFTAFGGNAVNKLLRPLPLAPHILADEIQLLHLFERIINRFHLQTHERKKLLLDRPLDLIAVLGPVDQKTQE